MNKGLRHMLRDDDLNHEEQLEVLRLGMAFRANPYLSQPYQGPQAVAIIFDKPSTRQDKLLRGCGPAGRLSHGHRQLWFAAGPWRARG